MKPTKCEEQGRAAGHRPPTQSAATWMPTFTSLHAAFQKGFLHAPPCTFALQNYSETTPEHALSLHWHCPPLLPGPSSACLPPVPAQTQGVCGAYPWASPSGCCSSASLIPPIHLQQGTSQLLSPQNFGLYHCELFKPLGVGETILTKPRAACWGHGDRATCRMLYSIDSAREHHLPRQWFS